MLQTCLSVFATRVLPSMFYVDTCQLPLLLLSVVFVNKTRVAHNDLDNYLKHSTVVLNYVQLPLITTIILENDSWFWVHVKRKWEDHQNLWSYLQPTSYPNTDCRIWFRMKVHHPFMLSHISWIYLIDQIAEGVKVALFATSRHRSNCFCSVDPFNANVCWSGFGQTSCPYIHNGSI